MEPLIVPTGGSFSNQEKALWPCLRVSPSPKSPILIDGKIDNNHSMDGGGGLCFVGDQPMVIGLGLLGGGQKEMTREGVDGYWLRVPAWG